MSTATSAQTVLSQSGNDEVGHVPDLGSVLTSPSTTQLSGAAPIAIGNLCQQLVSATSEKNLNKGPQTVKSPNIANSYTHLTPADMNPPKVTKVVVEHTVRNEEAPASYHAGSHLWAFSGRVP